MVDECFWSDDGATRYAVLVWISSLTTVRHKGAGLTSFTVKPPEVEERMVEW